MDDPGTDEGILKDHASLPTVSKCSENINTTSVQAVPGTRCPTTLSSMASTCGVPRSLWNLLLTNPTQAPKAHPDGALKLLPMPVMPWSSQHSLKKKTQSTPSGTKTRTKTLAVTDGPCTNCMLIPCAAETLWIAGGRLWLTEILRIQERFPCISLAKKLTPLIFPNSTQVSPSATKHP